jgi:hypothetical protein
VALLSETNKKGKGDEYVEDFIYFWNWVNEGKRANAGVSIVINKKYKKYITNWNFVNGRIVIIEISIFGRRMNVVGVLTNSYPGKKKTNFGKK